MRKLTPTFAGSRLASTALLIAFFVGQMVAFSLPGLVVFAVNTLLFLALAVSFFAWPVRGLHVRLWLDKEDAS